MTIKQAQLSINITTIIAILVILFALARIAGAATLEPSLETIISDNLTGTWEELIPDDPLPNDDGVTDFVVGFEDWVVEPGVVANEPDFNDLVILYDGSWFFVDSHTLYSHDWDDFDFGLVSRVTTPEGVSFRISTDAGLTFDGMDRTRTFVRTSMNDPVPEPGTIGLFGLGLLGLGLWRRRT